MLLQRPMCFFGSGGQFAEKERDARMPVLDVATGQKIVAGSPDLFGNLVRPGGGRSERRSRARDGDGDGNGDGEGSNVRWRRPSGRERSGLRSLRDRREGPHSGHAMGTAMGTRAGGWDERRSRFRHNFVKDFTHGPRVAGGRRTPM